MRSDPLQRQSRVNPPWDAVRPRTPAAGAGATNSPPNAPLSGESLKERIQAAGLTVRASEQQSSDMCGRA